MRITLAEIRSFSRWTLFYCYHIPIPFFSMDKLENDESAKSHSGTNVL